MTESSVPERRKFPRLFAPVFTRPRGLMLFSRESDPIDVSEGGVRIYSDDEMPVGSDYKIELFLPDGEAVQCDARVAWIEKLPAGSPAEYDVGLCFMGLSARDRERITDVIRSETDPENVAS